MPARRAFGFIGDPQVRCDVFIVLVVWAPAQPTALPKSQLKMNEFWGLGSLIAAILSYCLSGTRPSSFEGARDNQEFHP